MTLAFHFILFSFAIWMLFFSEKMDFSGASIVLYMMICLLILNAIVVVINHIMYCLNYDLLVKEYLQGKSTIALELLKRDRWREPPCLRSDGRRYMQLVQHFYKEWRMKSHLLDGVPRSLKLLVILFSLLAILQLLCVFLLFLGMFWIVTK